MDSRTNVLKEWLFIGAIRYVYRYKNKHQGQSWDNRIVVWSIATKWRDTQTSIRGVKKMRRFSIFLIVLVVCLQTATAKSVLKEFFGDREYEISIYTLSDCVKFSSQFCS